MCYSAFKNNGVYFMFLEYTLYYTVYTDKIDSLLNVLYYSNLQVQTRHGLSIAKGKLGCQRMASCQEAIYNQWSSYG